MKSSTVLSHRQLLAIDRDYKKAAKAANLHYLCDDRPGISRRKKGKTYSYSYKNKTLHEKETVERIRKLAIPPSWTNVWISPADDGHIQATGIDLNGRKQYRYHPEWNKLRNETKFHRLLEFGKCLPNMRKKMKKDLAEKDLSERKVLSTVITLMEQTYIRIGNNGYEKLYGSYGLTTLKDKHVSISKEKLHFCFVGKKGIEHTISVKDKRLARIIKQCKDIPGKELFQYYDDKGERRAIDSGKVNAYIKEISGGEFSAKDFRTWAGTLNALECFIKLAPPASEGDIKANVISVLEAVSLKLGNTRTICRKYYVHPGLIAMYEQNKLLPLLSKAKAAKTGNLEKVLLDILKKCL
jgi:DNA topoisomerase-1